MRSRSPLLRLAFRFGLVSSCGCGPQTDPPDEEREEPGIYAIAVCEAAERCGCYVPFADSADCEATIKDRLAALLELELTFDKECFESTIESSAFTTCANFEQIEAPCALLQGKRERGASCTEWRGHIPPFYVQECADGLSCEFGTCLDPEDEIPLFPEGAACSLYNGGICPSEVFGLHLYCGADNICHATSGPGEPCTSADACEAAAVPGVYCAGFGEDGSGICTTRGGLGDACDPRDSFPCELASGQLGWCDLDTNTCVETAPAVCNYIVAPERFEPAQP